MNAWQLCAVISVGNAVTAQPWERTKRRGGAASSVRHQRSCMLQTRSRFLGRRILCKKLRLIHID